MLQERIKAIIYGFGVGTAFGIALEKSKMFLPLLIRDQMTFTNFTMLKVFLTATAVGTIGIAILDTLQVRKKSVAPVRNFGGIPFGANIVGGALLGTGMSLAGACPGTVLVQLGVGVEKASYVYAGGLIGALLYGYLERIFRTHIAVKPGHAVPTKQGVSPLAFALLLGSVVIGVEQFRHYVADYNQVSTSLASRGISYSLSDFIWHPILAGVIIGLLQIPSILWIESPLGTSTSYCTVAGCVAHGLDSNVDKNAPYFANFFGINECGKMGLVAGMATGGFLSATLSNIPKEILVNPMPIPVVFVGGILLVFGARLAGGCTSGHGLSGMASLSISSFVTVASMFAGAMITALFI
jgi:uncharacterized membrane protein YedE/YeeE